MKLPKWMKRGDASLEQLEGQHAQAQKLVDSATVAVATAEDAFDADPGQEQALLDARTAEQSAREHLARAERLLAKKRAEVAEARRAELERRKAELEAGLTRLAIYDELEPTLNREVELICELVELRVQRVAKRREVQGRERELASVARELGDETPRTSVASAATDPSRLRERIEQIAVELDSGDRRRWLLLALRPTPAQYQPERRAVGT